MELDGCDKQEEKGQGNERKKDNLATLLRGDKEL